jgi:ABC-type lipoprotein export system ATPase subunit
MSTGNEFKSGSLWRKWDLHIHTPNTKLNNQYNPDGNDVWDTYCHKIEESDVKVFGITDYFSADTYFTFIKNFKYLYHDSDKIFFPNIELRISETVNKAQEEINLHLIFNSFDQNIEQKIHKFLQNLKTNKTVAGRLHVKASELQNSNDFEEATTTRTFINEAIIDTFGDKIDLTEFLLIFTSANNDGIRTTTEVVNGKKRGVKRKALITDEVDKFSNGFFGNSRNSEHFLKTNRLENKNEFIEPKPVLTGCDAHSFTDFDSSVGKLVKNGSEIEKEPTWIKADLTFEGLRQILYEPELRVYIGNEPEIVNRVRQNPTKYIKSLNINQVDEYDEHNGIWFKNETIEISSELVAIIGNKGSGKSAITDIIGLLANSYNQFYLSPHGHTEELFSFLNNEKFRKNNLASNFQGSLEWESGKLDTAELNSNIDNNIPEKVEYLPQKYLEKICANIDDDEFRDKLNNVIFGYVDIKDRFGTKNLIDLISYLTKQVEADLSLLKDSLHNINEDIVQIERKLTDSYKNEIDEKAKLKHEEIDAHLKIEPVKVIPPTQKKDGNENAKALNDLVENIKSLENKVGNLRKEQTNLIKEIEDLKQVIQTIERQVTALKDLKIDLAEVLEIHNLKFEDIVTVSVDYNKLENLVIEKQTRLKEIETLLWEEDIFATFLEDSSNIEKSRTKSLIYQLGQSEAQKEEIVDNLDKPLREYQNYLEQKTDWDNSYLELVGEDNNPIEETLNWLKQEQGKISNEYVKAQVERRKNREEITKKILRRKSDLISFYDSIKKSVDKEIKKYRAELGEYDIAIEATLRFEPLFYNDFFDFINQGVKGSFYQIDSGMKLLKMLCGNVIDWKNETHVMSLLNDIVDHLDYTKKPGSTIKEKNGIFRQMKQYKEPVDFYDYLFGLDYIHSKYDLKVDNKDLSELSPGERGGLLLVFYLMLDRREIPLIIDQPEDNLDNKSVYEILVTFLKKARTRRQIIMVTHNPNLAVVADAEQIIHVSIDKKNKNDFDFCSGSIENPKINKLLIDILEGTLPAFDNRRLKYRKQISI